MLSGHKAEQYARELDSARLRGDWLQDQPSQSAKKQLSWSELLRKFTKHNSEKTALANLASVEHQLKSSLQSFYADVKYNDEAHISDFNSKPSSSHSATLFPPVMNPGETGIGWSSDHVSKLIEQALAFPADAKQRQAAVSLCALALFSLGKDSEVIELLDQEKFMDDACAAVEQVETSESFHVALVIQGLVVYAMANERLSISKQQPGHVSFALAGYARAIQVHEAIRGGKKANALRGLPADEIERWAETALYRYALLSLRQAEPIDSLNALRAYQANAGRWPANFRPAQRNVIYRYYLGSLNRAAQSAQYKDPPTTPLAKQSQHDWRSNAFQQSVIASVASRVVIRDYASEKRLGDYENNRLGPPFSSQKVTTRTVSKRRPAAFRECRPPSVTWSNETLTIQKVAFTSLQNSIRFPRAGQTNTAVLQYADELIKGWQINGETGGQQADDLVEILYGLVGLTFHSQRIARYLVHVLFAAESYEEAKRALESYIHTVEMSRKVDQGSTVVVVEVAVVETEKQTQEATSDNDVDVDDDETYARTLAFGSHHVGRYCDDYATADQVAQKAVVVVENTNPKDTQLVALVKRVAASARAALAIQMADPAKRPTLQAEALALLTTSIQLDNQSSESFYQLAYLQAELRDVPAALVSARKAVELEPADVESWHLLVLLLSAKKKYRDAFQIAEVALAEAQDLTDDSAKPYGKGQGDVNGGGGGGCFSATQMLSVDYPLKRSERNESILRLMLTYNALEEVLDGVESSIQGQRELFAFFHKCFPLTAAAPSLISDVRSVIDDNVSSAGRSLNGGEIQPTALNGGGGGGRIVSLAQEGKPSSVGSFTKPAAAAALSMTRLGGGTDDDQNLTTSVSERNANQLQHLSLLLATIWLSSAASFRRAGQLKECKTAIQEAERLQPGLADVWVQLALYFYESKRITVAVDSLYKALACSRDHVAASIHLAHIFLQHPDIQLKTVNNNDFDVCFKKKGETRTISSVAAAATAATEEKTSVDLSTVSLAEGLLNSVTKGSGWDVSEAWLFLGRAVQKSHRSLRARECLEYALVLENSKAIRPLCFALRR